MKQINYLWRLLATAMSFILFALGGVMVGLVVYPLLWLSGQSKNPRNGQKIIHYLFKFFAGFMRIMGIHTLEVINKDRLSQPNQFFVANHPTLIDVVLLLAHLPQSDCVVKSALMKHPATRGPLLAAGYIVNDEPEQLLQSCQNSLRKGHNLLLFPEGTRTKRMDQLKFKRGAALVAATTQHDITPIFIRCQPRMLAKGQKWYKIPETRPHFTIKVGETIHSSTLIDSSAPQSVTSRRINEEMLSTFKKELNIE